MTSQLIPPMLIQRTLTHGSRAMLDCFEELDETGI